MLLEVTIQLERFVDASVGVSDDCECTTIADDFEECRQDLLFAKRHGVEGQECDPVRA